MWIISEGNFCPHLIVFEMASLCMPKLEHQNQTSTETLILQQLREGRLGETAQVLLALSWELAQ